MQPSNPYVRDAEAAGRYALAFIRPQKPWERDASVDVIYTLARWAAHWAALALAKKAA